MTLAKAVAMLIEKYEKGVQLEYIHNPLAWALYQVWLKADKEGGQVG